MVRDPMGAIEQELQAERVAALARIAARFETALGVWNALEAGTLPPLSSLRAQVARRLELRDAAAEALWMLLVQRESIGLRDHRGVLEDVPREIRLRAAPRRHVTSSLSRSPPR